MAVCTFLGVSTIIVCLNEFCFFLIYIDDYECRSDNWKNTKINRGGMLF